MACPLGSGHVVYTTLGAWNQEAETVTQDLPTVSRLTVPDI